MALPNSGLNSCFVNSAIQLLADTPYECRGTNQALNSALNQILSELRALHTQTGVLLDTPAAVCDRTSARQLWHDLGLKFESGQTTRAMAAQQQQPHEVTAASKLTMEDPQTALIVIREACGKLGYTVQLDLAQARCMHPICFGQPDRVVDKTDGMDATNIAVPVSRFSFSLEEKMQQVGDCVRINDQLPPNVLQHNQFLEPSHPMAHRTFSPLQPGTPGRPWIIIANRYGQYGIDYTTQIRFPYRFAGTKMYLRGFCVHQGAHFTYVCRHNDGIWWKYDDELRKLINPVIAASEETMNARYSHKATTFLYEYRETDFPAYPLKNKR